MNEPFNKLTPAQVERLALLSEELGEAQQAIGKILRHGFDSVHPQQINGPDNRQSLERELGDVKAAIDFAERNHDISKHSVEHYRDSKLGRLLGGLYLHHQGYSK